MVVAPSSTTTTGTWESAGWERRAATKSSRRWGKRSSSFLQDDNAEFGLGGCLDGGGRLHSQFPATGPTLERPGVHSKGEAGDRTHAPRHHVKHHGHVE